MDAEKSLNRVGWALRMKRAADWVLEGYEMSERSNQRMSEIYKDAYKEHWDNFLTTAKLLVEASEKE